MSQNQAQMSGPMNGDHANHAAMILNSQDQWQEAIRDSCDDPDMIVNANGTLRHEDERSITEKVTAVRKRNLNGIADLMSAGLTKSEDIGTQLMGVENVNEFQEAEQSMNPTQMQNNNTTFDLSYTPLPITHSGFRIPFRQNGFSYKNALGVSAGVRAVAERLEKTLFNGNTNIVVTVNGTQSAIFGYTTFPDRSIVGISIWSNPANSGKIISDTLLMTDAAFVEGSIAMKDSMVMYVAPNLWNVLEDDYSAQKGDRTFKQRIEAITVIKEVKVGELLADDVVVMVEMDERTVELGVATDIISVPHTRLASTSDQVFSIYAAMQAQFKSDRNDKSGIVHGVPS